MEENKDYQVYRFDYLTEGSQLKLEHNVYCEDVDISSLITQGADALEALRQDSIDGRAESPCNRAGGGKTMGTAGGSHTEIEPLAGIPADPGGCTYGK